MNIYLIRHGQTDINKEQRIQGRKGLPLNETGIKQTKLAKQKLENIKFDLVFSSPQERAVQTAYLTTDIEPIIDERLNSYDLGSADNLKLSEVKTILNGVMPDPSIYSGVEEISHYLDRINNFMNELCEKYQDKNVNILISGHKCTTGCISAYFEGMPEDGNFLKLSSPNADFKVFKNASYNYLKTLEKIKKY